MRKLFVLLILLFCISSCSNTGNLIWHGNLNSKNIFLTFDDGPNPINTPQILKILKEHDVKACFFLIGEKAKGNPKIVKQIFEQGHDIGNHTYSHLDGYDINGKTILNEIKGTHDIVKNITGAAPKYFRPPFGFFNFRYIQTAEDLGYKTILWTFDIGDWNNLKSDEIENRILAKTKGGSIILLHDAGKNREELIKALPGIIVNLKSENYKFRRLTVLP